MTETTQPYDIKIDLDDQLHNYLRVLLWLTLYLAILLFVVATMTGDSLPWVCLAGTMVITYALDHFRFKNAAAWVYILGIVTLPVGYIALYGPNPTSALLLVLPIVLCSLVRDRNAMVKVTAVSLCATAIAVLLHTNLGATLSFMIVPSFVCVVVAAAMYVNEHNIMEIMYWSLDIQRKDTRRAEMFYEQKEQLAEAMLQVQHANSALEILNKRLEVAQQKAEQASQTKSVFMSNMSHELRTPLNIIIGYSSSMLSMPQMFDNVPLPSIYQPYLKLIEDNGHYLLGLINDILDLSKIEAGKLDLHPVALDLPDLLRGTISTSIGLLKEKPLQLRPNFPDPLPPVWADPLRVRQIILNLMSNAIKFTPSGSVTLSAAVEEDCIHISVTDTGIGIPESALKTIFDRFQQAEHDTDKRYGGTGLGLDISKQLSLMHGGDLTVQSMVNQGSTFSFTLPIARADQIAPAQPMDVKDDRVKIFDLDGMMAVNPRTILLVEDETSTREMVHSALESAGYVVIDANEGEQAFELATGLLPDLILMDITLPGIDGWDLLALLKADRETDPIPVMLLTAAPDAERAYELGAVSVLKKPVTPGEVLSSIQTILISTAE